MEPEPYDIQKYGDHEAYAVKLGDDFVVVENEGSIEMFGSMDELEDEYGDYDIVSGTIFFDGE